MGEKTEFSRRPGRIGRGFTLIELLIVIAIIALLLSMLVPSLRRVYELGRRTACKGNLRTLGTAWYGYWTENKYEHPGINCGIGDQGLLEYYSQGSYFLYWDRRLTNAGVLYKQGYLGNPDVFICKTIDMGTGRPWFDDTAGAFMPVYGPNVWPPGQFGTKSRMCYGTRRTHAYDDPQLASADNTGDADKNRILLTKTGVSGIETPSGFSFMADAFQQPEIAEMSHVPGVNVLFLAGNVDYVTDDYPDGDMLYFGNGIGSGGHNFNYEHDRIWMKIDEKRRGS